MTKARQSVFLEKLEAVSSALLNQPDDGESARVLIEALADLLIENDLGTNSQKERQLSIDILTNNAVWIALSSLRRTREKRLLEQKESSLHEVHQQLLKNNMALRERTMIDDLTGLFNRRYFERNLAYEIERYRRYDRPVGVVLFDVDHFKRINDTYGHSVGDNALKHLSEVARSMIRSADILARYGGEEFTLLLPETGLEGTSIMAERLRERVSLSPLCLKKGDISMTVSCGVTAIQPPFDGGIDDVMRAVDGALYDAKGEGRNRVSVA